MTFSDDLGWSLSAANTSTAVTLLSAVWPACSWVTTCSMTDQAGVDLLGYRDGKQPARIDAKYRRVSDARRRFFDASDPDGVFDISYESSDGQRRPGPVLRYDGHRAAPPCDYYLYCYPDESPPSGLLVDAKAAHHWLSDNYTAVKSLTSATTRDDGLTWTTTFIPVPGSLLNARAGRTAARLLTVDASGSVRVTHP